MLQSSTRRSRPARERRRKSTAKTALSKQAGETCGTVESSAKRRGARARKSARRAGTAGRRSIRAQQFEREEGGGLPVCGDRRSIVGGREPKGGVLKRSLRRCPRAALPKGQGPGAAACERRAFGALLTACRQPDRSVVELRVSRLPPGRVQPLFYPELVAGSRGWFGRRACRGELPGSWRVDSRGAQRPHRETT